MVNLHLKSKHGEKNAAMCAFWPSGASGRPCLGIKKAIEAWTSKWTGRYVPAPRSCQDELENHHRDKEDDVKVVDVEDGVIKLADVNSFV